MQSNIKSATLEHPGYVDILLADGNRATVGYRGIEYHGDGADEGVTSDAVWRNGDRIDIGDVASITCERCARVLHGYGEGPFYVDYITLNDGLCIVVSADGISVYATADDARADGEPLADLNF